MFKVFLLQSLASLYDPLILQAVAQVSLFTYLFTVSRRTSQNENCI